jgi:hypothetical protein
MIYSKPIKTLARCDGRYPTEAEEDAVLAWASSVPKRLQVANLIAQHEQDIVREAIEAVRPEYPRFAPQHDRAWEKAQRDMGLVLRYAVQGIIADDSAMANDKLYVWLGTIVRGLGHTPGFFRDCYTAVTESCRNHLPADAFALAQPYLQRMTEDMSAFPEPLKAAVN